MREDGSKAKRGRANRGHANRLAMLRSQRVGLVLVALAVLVWRLAHVPRGWWFPAGWWRLW